jgi:hypothetical protein
MRVWRSGLTQLVATQSYVGGSNPSTRSIICRSTINGSLGVRHSLLLQYHANVAQLGEHALFRGKGHWFDSSHSQTYINAL